MIPIRDLYRSLQTPVATIWLIAINVVVFLYEILLDPYSRNHFVTEYGLIPADFRWLDIITSMFLHGGWMHLIANMMFLWVFGDNIEDILGRARYLLFYILCGVAAALTQLAANPESKVPLIGASGAIGGVMGAYLVKFPHARIVMLVPFIFFFTVELPALVVLLYWFILQVFSGFGSIADVHLGRGGTAYFAHIGGFLTGMVLIWLMRPSEPYRSRRDLSWNR